MGSAGVQLSLVIPEILSWIEVWALTRPFQDLYMFPLKPLKCCFSSMLRAIVLLEGEPPYQSQLSGRLKQGSLKNFSVFSAIHHSFNSDQFPSP